MGSSMGYHFIVLGQEAQQGTLLTREFIVLAKWTAGTYYNGMEAALQSNLEYRTAAH